MKKTNCLILTRDDLKPGFQDMDFYTVLPDYFLPEVVKEMTKHPIVVFVGSSANQVMIDKKTRLLKNTFGLYGIVSTLR